MRNAGLFETGSYMVKRFSHFFPSLFRSTFQIFPGAFRALPQLQHLRESVNTEIPVTISSSCTNGDAAYEDEHLGTQRRIDGDGGFNW
ncbi:MAG: hypothetical protein ACYCY5_12820, partial [Sulfuricella sp.]